MGDSLPQAQAVWTWHLLGGHETPLWHQVAATYEAHTHREEDFVKVEVSYVLCLSTASTLCRMDFNGHRWQNCCEIGNGMQNPCSLLGEQQRAELGTLEHHALHPTIP